MSGPPYEEPLPLVLLHGFLGAADDWDEVAWELADERTVVAVDLPGHEPADEPLDADADPLPNDLPAMARSVAHHLDTLGFDRVDLAGYSLGGRVAAAFVAETPKRVGRVALISARLQPDPDPGRAERDRAWADRLRHDGIAAFLDAWWAQPVFAGLRDRIDLAALKQRRARGRVERLAHVLEATTPARQPDLLPALAASGVPVLFVTGSRDVAYAAMARELIAHIPGARHESIAGAGHALPFEAPSALAAALRVRAVPA